MERWGTPGSPQRQAAVDQAYADADAWGSLGEGFLSGGAVSLLSTAAELGVVRFLATRGVSQAARAAGPVGAVVGGIIGAYSLWNRGFEGIGSALSMTGYNEGTGDELMANRWHAIAELLDVLGAIADVIAGVAGIVALAGTLIGLIPGGQWALPAVPIATQVAFWGGVVGLACGIMKGIAQQVSRYYREQHLLHMELAGNEEMLYQQQQLTSQVQAGYQFIGGMAGTATVAAGRHAVGGRTPRESGGRAAAESVPPRDPTVITARQRATPERLQQMRNVDDALAGRPSEGPGGVRPARAETDAAVDGASQARSRHDDALARHEQSSAAARRMQAEADAAAAAARQADAEHAAARQDADARNREHDAGLEQQASRDAAETMAREHAARAEQARADVQAKDTAAADARSQQGAAQRDVDRLEAEARRHRATEAAALEQYNGMERGQMALALAEDARFRAEAAEAQLADARQRLDQATQTAQARQAEADAARSEYESAQAAADALRDHAANVAERPSDESLAASRQQAVEANSRSAEARERARQAHESAQAARERAEQQSLNARQRERDVQHGAQAIDAADRRVRQAHVDEVDAAREQPNAVRDVAQEAAGVGGGGGTAQDVLGEEFQAAPERTREVPAPCLTLPPPTSSAAIERDTVEAAAHEAAANQAAAQRDEAEADQQARAQDRANLTQLSDSVTERRADADRTSQGLDQRQQTQTRLEQTQQATDSEVDEAATKTSDLTSFARFIARMMRYAARLDDDLFPDSIRAAGRGMAERGDQVQANTTGATQGIEQQRSGRGAVQARTGSQRAATSQAQGAMPGTTATIDESSTQVTEMLAANEERAAAAQQAAAANSNLEAQARSQADALTARRRQNRAALDAWADESRAAREQWIDQTTSDLGEQGYEVVEVRGE